MLSLSKHLYRFMAPFKPTCHFEQRPMPFIALVNKNSGNDFQELRLVKLYMDLFGTGLKEAREQVEFMLYKEGGYLIPIAEADIGKAAHFVYQSCGYGIVCQLRSASSA